MNDPLDPKTRQWVDRAAQAVVADVLSEGPFHNPASRLDIRPRSKYRPIVSAAEVQRRKRAYRA